MGQIDTFDPKSKGDPKKKLAVVNEALCKGCGTCAASCTKHALIVKHFTDEQIMSEILALVQGGGK